MPLIETYNTALSKLPSSSNKPIQPPIIAFAGTLRRLFFGTSTSPAAMVSAKEKAQSIIDSNAVVVFSKSYCPYCKATKNLLDEKKAKYELLELDQICES